MKRWLVIVGLIFSGTLPRMTMAATLSISSAGNSLEVGQTVVATVRVNTEGATMNAAEATVSFPSDLLKLTAISKADSIMSFWTVEPSGSNSSAQVIFSGGLSSPGYSGSAGTIIKITWQALGAGTAAVRISGGKILANDGLGTNVLTGQTGATYTIMAASVTPPPPTKPTGPVTPTVSSTDFSSEQQWYNDQQATLNWTRSSDMEGISYEVTGDPTTVPDDTFEANTGVASMTLPADGKWYFHLRAKYATGWSATSHFLLQRDTTPPEPFTISVARDRGLADPSPTLSFSATDALSNITGYSAVINGKPSMPVTSPLTVTADQAGEYHVVITAIDGAGNTRDSDTTFSVEGYRAPVITYVSTPLILLQTLSLRGTAQAGDRVNIFVDGELVGSTSAGAANLAVTDGTSVRLPWSFTSPKSFGLGAHQVTVTATSADGQTSIASDPVTLKVRGQTIEFRGHQIATFAAIPALGIVVIIFFTAVAFVMTRLWVVTWQFERRETIVDQELRALKTAVSKRRIPEANLEQAITLIDDDLVGRRRVSKRSARRRKKTP